MNSNNPTHKNYMTPSGFASLQAELRDLKKNQRPQITETVAWAASNGDRSENGDYIYGKKKLREIDKRIRYLMKRLDAAEVIDPALIKSDEVKFGATVTFLDEEGEEKSFTIVGEDEADVSKGTISWKSPLASRLLRAKAKEGDILTYQTPKGEKEIEIVSVVYPK